MNTSRLPILLFFLLTLLAGCGNDAAIEQILDAAEAKMTEHPDSSLSLLSEIDPGQINSDDTRARHALLLSQAKDKNYIDETNDSLINIAVDHYASGDNPYYQFLSLYYQGRVYYNAQNYTKSILSYTQAEQLIDKFDNPRPKALLYAQIAMIYKQMYDLPKGIEAYKKAYLFYEDSGDKLLQYHTLIDIALLNFDMKQYLGIESSLFEPMEWAYNNQQYDLCLHCVRSLFIIYINLGEFQKIKELLNSKFYEICKNDRTILESQAYLEALHNNNDQSRKYINEAWNSAYNLDDTISIYHTIYAISREQNNSDTALVYLENLYNIQDSIIREVVQQPIATAQRDYYKQDAELNEYKLRVNRFRMTIILIIVVLISGFVFIYYRHRMILKEAEINEYIADVRTLRYELVGKENIISDLSKQIESKDSMLDEFSEKLRNLFGKQFELLDDLTNTYYESLDNKRYKDSIYKRVQSEIEQFSMNTRNMFDIEQIINEYKENVMAIIRRDVKLSAEEYQLACLIYAGFSTKSISVFTKIAINNIYTRKSRIKASILEQNPDSVNLIMKYWI